MSRRSEPFEEDGPAQIDADEPAVTLMDAFGRSGHQREFEEHGPDGPDGPRGL